MTFTAYSLTPIIPDIIEDPWKQDQSSKMTNMLGSPILRKSHKFSRTLLSKIDTFKALLYSFLLLITILFMIKISVFVKKLAKANPCMFILRIGMNK